jgi:fungal STAND N-terminal Goodbye domain
MSSTSHAISMTSTSTFKVILDNALKDYTKKTGIDLAKCDFAKQLEGYNSPDGVLRLFEKKERQFKEHRDGNMRLLKWITPIVQVVHVLSGCLAEGVVLVSCYTNVPFALLV